MKSSFREASLLIRKPVELWVQNSMKSPQCPFDGAAFSQCRPVFFPFEPHVSQMHVSTDELSKQLDCLLQIESQYHAKENEGSH
ncbi:hypothetical protein M5W83_27720 [Paenibacillus thiaminolyticus]|uniref:Uncharacterized protein n=2 Tax=Paenibacillus thiaminolyticus TaxID=49283 RepID=A0ABT4G4D2_PANTH|nr:hypothetical protein [Paenibacillus thiaminolyticus]MCY9604497.1 hypothetical protein [Paenibacillus thiaminolyticus]MCY9610938.1 hypothetical protein [Paenibacillus thiaminolyticus]MCY9654325.1 hypothetical protein [Paenibacillus thiaminolyticus]CAH8712448.1 hypothetical protein KYE0_002910 [Paenibacillus thiaminolyticus]